MRDIKLSPLKTIEDNRGSVKHMLRNDSPCFLGMGELYISTVKFRAVKAWKRHLKMTQNIAVPIGTIKIVLFDNRSLGFKEAQIQEIELGEENYQLLHIPPMIWYGFCGLSKTDGLIVNCADIVYDSDEVERLPENTLSIPYDWQKA